MKTKKLFIKILNKIDNFFTAIAIFTTILLIIPGDLNPPKKKDYVGRIIISTFGFIIFFFLLFAIFAIIEPLITKLINIL